MRIRKTLITALAVAIAIAFSPLPDLVSERIATLARLSTLQHGILLVSAETLLQRLPPRDRTLTSLCGVWIARQPVPPN